MARLSSSQAIQVIKEPKNQKEIQQARENRHRLQLHTEAEMDNQTQRRGSELFLSWAKSLIGSGDNYDRFRSLYRHPISTTKLTGEITDEFKRVFDSENAYENFEFTDPSDENDMSEYRKRIGDDSFWQNQGFNTFRNSPENVLIVDLPKAPEPGQEDGEDSKPKPYYYILDIDSLIDIDNTEVSGLDSSTGKSFTYFRTEYVVFKGKDGMINVFDDIYYRVFSQEEGKDPVLVMETPHFLNYCPAQSFWTDPLNSRTTIQKQNVITRVISELDWLLFFSIAGKYLKLYAPFPIYAVYKGRCDYKQEGTKMRCVDGYLEEEGSRAIGGQKTKCPKCGNKIKVGPGNVMEFKAPAEADSPNLMENPMKVIPAETESLAFVNQELKDLEAAIFSACTGRSKESNNQAAKNEDQIASGFESAQAAMLYVKQNFEVIKHFALDTVARLRYGDRYLGCSISLGDEFFKATEAGEMKSYTEAKTAGLPEYDLQVRREAIDRAKFANNPKTQERIKIMASLMPYPDQSVKELAEIRSKMPEAVPITKYLIKMNFVEYISRFERENANLTLFGSKLEFGMKISQIKSVLLAYAEEDKKAGEADKPKPEPAPFSGGPGAGGFPPKV